MTLSSRWCVNKHERRRNIYLFIFYYECEIIDRFLLERLHHKLLYSYFFSILNSLDRSLGLLPCDVSFPSIFVAVGLQCYSLLKPKHGYPWSAVVFPAQHSCAPSKL